ncbi:MAG: hypothetical protein ACI9EK_002495, partial [Psychroserpens sp.]
MNNQMKKLTFIVTAFLLLIQLSVLGTEKKENNIVVISNNNLNVPDTGSLNDNFYDTYNKEWENFDARKNANKTEVLSAISSTAISSTETIPSGSYVIAMDDALQGGGNFNLKAYGLVVRLLHAGIPLKWAIKSNKAKDGTDFSATASRIKPSSQSSQTRNFKSGPIIVYPGFESQALTIINSFGNNVYVYRTTQSKSVEIFSDLTHKPKAAIFSDGGKASIHTSIYSAAGLTSGTHYNSVSNSSSIMNANSCYTFASEPHSDHSDTSKKNNVESFLRSGGNFLAQCHGVESYTRLGLLSGYSNKNNGGSETYSN